MHNVILIKKLYRQRFLYLMLLPAIALTLIFSYSPLAGWVMAFKDYQLGHSIFDGDFTGLKQFKMFFLDTSDAWYVIRNTIAINLLSLIVNLFVASLFAILLNEVRIKLFKRVVQSFSFFPFFVSWIITYQLFYTFLGQNSGVINNLLIHAGLVEKGINFLGDPGYAWGLITFVSLWKTIGYNSVIFLAAITSIDQEQYEAAEIDGAGRFGRIWHITVPGLASTLVVLIIINFGYIFSSNFEQFFMFTNPTNWQNMEVLDVYIYKYGLKMLDFSYATAVGIVKTVASIFMLYIVNGAMKRINGHSII